MDEQVKTALLARLLRTLATPVPHTPQGFMSNRNPEQLQQLETTMRSKLKSNINQPIENGLKKIDAGGFVGKIVNEGLHSMHDISSQVDLPKRPAFLKSLSDPATRQSISSNMGNHMVEQLAQNPETALLAKIPVPFVTEGYLAGKNGLKKLLKIPR